MAITHAWHDAVHDMRDEMRDLTSILNLDAARQAYLALWGTCMAVPLVFGLDKFAGVMTDTWERYLPSWGNDLLPGSASDAMLWIGGIEIVVAALVALLPRIGGDVFAVWMGITAIGLFSIGGMHELAVGAIALGLMGLAMARLSRTWHHTEG